MLSFFDIKKILQFFVASFLLIHTAHAAEIYYDSSNKILKITGEIKEGDDTIFEKALRENSFIKHIQVNSGGGDPTVALKIGEIIYHEKRGTHIADNGKCMSACNFIYAGGMMRTAGKNVCFGVHGFSFFSGSIDWQSYKFTDEKQHCTLKNNTQSLGDVANSLRTQNANPTPQNNSHICTFTGEELKQEITEFVNRTMRISSKESEFLVKMGFSKDLIVFMLSDTNMRFLTTQEMLPEKYNIINSPDENFSAKTAGC